ncbi:hypothetical protein C8R44DRAFT_723834 [Mycena epipterygia]|nr:hypothetical protein C8R44DRAFT_723834 [Mycena epipterygia]
MSETDSLQNSLLKPSEAQIKRWNRQEALECYEKKRRDELKKSESTAKAAQQKCRKWDAEHREQYFFFFFQLPLTQKHGYKEFLDSYMPLLTESNGFNLAGVKVPTKSQHRAAESDAQTNADEEIGGDA